jgi:uncharacterized protein YbcI
MVRPDTPDTTLLTNGELLAAISNHVVSTYANRLGRGPTRARSYITHDLVVCLMEDTMQKAEQTLLASGAGDTLAEVRGRYQEAMREELCAGIEALTSRRVLAFVGGNSVSPDIASELFVLDGPPATSGPSASESRPEPAAKLVRRVD